MVEKNAFSSLCGVNYKMHIPVLAKEILQTFLENLPANFAGPLKIIDATFGAGGHSRILLEAIPNIQLYAFDRDPSVAPYAEKLKAEYPNFLWLNCKFSELSETLEQQALGNVHGILADFGVSSMQIDQAKRGFSFGKTGPLLMSMGRNRLTAEQVVNTYSSQELLRIICEYGEEKINYARKIVDMICMQRKKSRITTTEQLAQIIAQALGLKDGGKTKGSSLNCCTKTFQALRIEVNQELQEIDEFLRFIPSIMAPGGVAQFISFHALEDRMVKRFCKKIPLLDNGSANSEIKSEFMQLYDGRAIKPGRTEIMGNRRARSAKLRGIKRLA